MMTLADLAKAIGARIQPDQALHEVTSVASLEHAGPESLTFLSDERHLEALKATRAGAVLLQERHADHSPAPCLLSDNPHAAFAHAAALLCPP
ncbi:LpxD N-terminal domain-containing protein, partial [Acidihalobacter prosperus]